MYTYENEQQETYPFPVDDKPVTLVVRVVLEQVFQPAHTHTLHQTKSAENKGKNVLGFFDMIPSNAVTGPTLKVERWPPTNYAF